MSPSATFRKHEAPSLPSLRLGAAVVPIKTLAHRSLLLSLLLPFSSIQHFKFEIFSERTRPFQLRNMALPVVFVRVWETKAKIVTPKDQETTAPFAPRATQPPRTSAKASTEKPRSGIFVTPASYEEAQAKKEAAPC